jgi:hypothetical protein
VLLLALLVQGTAVQTHLHFVGQAHARAVAASDGANSAFQPGKTDTSTPCRLCQEAAMAGAYVLPSAAVLPLPPAPARRAATAATVAFGLLVPAHGWQSRAPPQ